MRLLYLLLAWSGAAAAPTQSPPAGQPNSLVASWYGPKFHGRPTANGEIFDMHQLTAAHRELPFGSRLRVTCPETGRSVMVRINDRGPFIPGRDLDLSRAAARRLGMEAQGLATVLYERVAN